MTPSPSTALRPTTRRSLLTMLLGLCLTLTPLSFVAPDPAHASKRAQACKGANAVPQTGKQARRAERAARCLVNRRRDARGLGRLRHAPRLTRASRRHSRYMVQNNCFAHQCPGGPPLVQRLRGAGYLVSSLLGWRVGENIAWGTYGRATPRNIVRAWMQSPGHRQNMLDGRYREFGMGAVLSAPGRTDQPGGTYTNNFGTRSR